MAKFCSKCGSSLDADTGLCPVCDKENPAENVTVQSYCLRCGAIVDPKTGVCPKCNYGAEKSAASEETSPAPAPGDESAPHVTPVETAKKPRGVGAGAAVVTVLLAIILFVTTLASIVILDARSITDDDAIERVLNDVNVVDVLYDSGLGDDRGLNDFYGYIETNYEVKITDDQLEAFLDKSTVKPFIAEKVSDFAEDFLEEDGELVLTRKEIAKLLRENSKLIEKELDIPMKDEDIEKVSDWIVGEEALVIVNTREFKGDSPEVFKAVRIGTSYITLAIFAAVSALLIFAMLMISVTKGLCGVGVDFIIVGAVSSAVSLVAFFLPSLLGDMGLSYIGSMIGSLIAVNALTGVLFLVVGIILLVVRHFIVRSRKKKAA